MHLFYSPEIKSDIHILDTAESRHCIKVLRLQEGDLIHLTNGEGKLFKTIIDDANPNKCKLQVVDVTDGEDVLLNKIHIAVAPTKNISRFEWFLEKATEIGITDVTPLICEHSERRSVNTDRLEKVMISALKQSLKSFLPTLHKPLKYNDFISSSFEGQKFIASYHPENKELKDLYTKGNDCLALIGPEGDFSDEEIKNAIKNGFTPTNLGQNRLRTETAALVACHTINLLS